jgi:protein-glutamine gamma-glutamyltransferase
MLRKHFAFIIALAFVLSGSGMTALAQMPFDMYQMPGMSSSTGIPETQALRSQSLAGVDTNRGFDQMPAHEAAYRSAIVSNSVTFHKKMSSGRLAFGRHMESQYFNTKYWEPVYIKGSQFWKLKDDVSSLDAMNDFISPEGGKYKIDCAAAINLLILKSKLDTVGERNFNKRLPNLLIRGWKTYTTSGNGDYEEYQALEKWSGSEMEPGTPNGLKTGDYVYFKNHPMMEGSPEQGENALYMGTDTWGRPVFFGLNVGMSRGTFNQYGILSSERGTIDPDKLKQMME